MKHLARRIFRSFQIGDTIIEVLLATTAISAVLIGSYVLVSQSTQSVRSGQERSEMTQVIQGQVERVRALALKQNSTAGGIYDTSPQYFCVDPATGARADFDVGFALPAKDADDFTKYADACRGIDGRYNVAITYDDFSHVFNFTGRWDRFGGGREQVSLVYRILPGAVAIKPVVQPCSAINDIALVLDNSTSMNTAWQTGTRRQKLISVTRDFIANTGITPALNHASIIEFNDSARTLQILTGDTAALNNAVGLMALRPGTNYLAGLNAADARFGASDARPGIDKIIVFISDGLPRDPLVNINAKASELRGKGYSIYTIAVNTDVSAQNVLRDMAGGTNGGFAAADSEQQLVDAIKKISGQLRCN